MRVWGKEAIMWPCMAAGGREGTKASVALVTNLSGSPFVTRTQTVGASGLRLETGALDKNRNYWRWCWQCQCGTKEGGWDYIWSG